MKQIFFTRASAPAWTLLVSAAALLAMLALAGTAALANPAYWKQEWPNTDFSRSLVEFSEILSGGPPRDGIPAIDSPGFHRAGEERDLQPAEPVITVELEGEIPRAYPLRYLTWHEIVNDQIGGRHIVVTFCPLCNSALVFDARVDGKKRTFGVSGKLRSSDMIMFDRETESWWQQAVGEGIVGFHAGDSLDQLPSWLESWSGFKGRNPDGLVMSKPKMPRPYGINPYVNYDTSARPFLFSGELPANGMHPLKRVVRVGDVAWPLERLRREREISEEGVTITWQPGQSSALDTRSIAEGRDVGSVRVRDGAGKDLPHDVMFAFAFHAFYPDGIWRVGER